MAKDVNIKAAEQISLKVMTTSRSPQVFFHGAYILWWHLYKVVRVSINSLTYLACVNYHPSRAIYLQFPWKKFIYKHREAHRQQFVYSLFICRFCSSLSDSFPMLPDAKARRKSTSSFEWLLTHPITLLLLLPCRKQFSIERSQWYRKTISPWRKQSYMDAAMWSDKEKSRWIPNRPWKVTFLISCFAIVSI